MNNNKNNHHENNRLTATPYGLISIFNIQRDLQTYGEIIIIIITIHVFQEKHCKIARENFQTDT
jgi:hypothetical protein